MIVISGSSHPRLAIEIGLALQCKALIKPFQEFSDHEIKPIELASLKDDTVVIVQSTSNPADKHIFELLLLIHAAKRAQAARIIVVIPYYGYAREHHSATLVAQLLSTASIDHIVTIDIHQNNPNMAHLKWTNLTATPLLLHYLNIKPTDVIVFPDAGSRNRLSHIATSHKYNTQTIPKIRDPNGIVHMPDHIENIANQHCIIVDDIVDSGDTLAKCAKLLYCSGAQSVSAAITHPVFSKNNLPLDLFKQFAITNTIHQANPSKHVVYVSVSKLLADAIKDIAATS